MNPYLWYAITQAVGVGITVCSVTFLERRRLRISGNFERKQEHYADLFDVLYRVTSGLRKWHSNVFVSPDTGDLEEIQKSLDAKDVIRLDALNQIWSSPKVIECADRWIEHRLALASALTTLQELKTLLTVEQRIELKQQADVSRDAMIQELEQVRQAIKEDLYLTRKRRRAFGLLP